MYSIIKENWKTMHCGKCAGRRGKERHPFCPQPQSFASSLFFLPLHSVRCHASL